MKLTIIGPNLVCLMSLSLVYNYAAEKKEKMEFGMHHISPVTVKENKNYYVVRHWMHKF